MQRAYAKYITYYFKNAYKQMPKQKLPTQTELEEVSKICYKLKEPNQFKSYYSNGNAKYAVDFFQDYIENSISDNQYKIIMKIAYNDGINNNRHYFNKSKLIHTKLLEKNEQNEKEEQEERNKKWENRTPEKKQKQKEFEKHIRDTQMDYLWD